VLKLTFLAAVLMAKTWFITPASPPADSPGSHARGDSLTGSLQATIDRAAPGDTIFLASGIYRADPEAYTESVCGNCVQPLTPVEATVGFKIIGKPLVIVGEDADRAILVTNAGYGVFFKDSHGSSISNLTLTGGIRDSDGNATDAAIVAKHSRVTVEGLRIIDNTDRVDTVVVGIGGVFGREGSELHVLNNVIRNNGWDGIALYRGASAVIADNVIDTGRGAGIGITWDSNAIVFRNSISGYWKGIGSFGTTWVSARNNAVFDNLGWGMVATGRSCMEVSNNVIHHNGNCGFAVWEETARGSLRNNIITQNGWRDEWVCPGVGVWVNAPLEAFPVLNNNVWDNAAGNYEGLPDQTGLNGNISADPHFEGSHSFVLGAASPCIDAGDSIMIDADGTRSDMGIFGGPQGRRSR
jgi:parallel beta-helix repeat protein